MGGLSAASEHQLGVDAWWQGAISDGTAGGDSTSDAWRRAREREMGLQVRESTLAPARAAGPAPAQQPMPPRFRDGCVSAAMTRPGPFGRAHALR